ncbi:long-chain acyl-CoA synthetase [Angulomicrobium tetraedrale]|uniref:Long-chain acyl-CoA synthetase n=1 Tax=Ancylobacter tetraedralis TaxID=217068 RepID=A0A839ZFF7_9HYPH|nr:class I adenylate-forming enzyme family protein [Ancylobacter tetraedralis]MBB3773418.1 long-chain acyl-CoA synthetase [Ancylobacter tetraedralis]
MTTARPSPVYGALLEIVARQPDKVAMTFEDRTLTYADFLGGVDRTATHFRAARIGPGVAVAMYGQNSPEIMFGYYAAARLGAIFVPVNSALTAAEVDYTLQHSGASKLYFDDSVGEAARAVVPAAMRIHIDTLAEPIADATDGNEGDVSVTPDDDFLIMYTSGTTGTPKAVMLTQGGQANAAKALARMWGIGETDTVLVALPLGFLYGLSTASAVALQAGARVALLPRFHPRDVLEGFVKWRAQVFQGVPTMFSMMLEYSEQRDLTFDLSFMRALVAAGAPLSPELKERFAARFGKRIDNYYAMTEVTPIFGAYHDDPRPVPDAAIGRAAPLADIRIVRADGSPCAEGEEGEILVRGAATLKYYYKNLEQTAQVMTDGYFRSGDLGYRDVDGYYYISGRIKDIIIRGGANISPAEVETALTSHPSVQDAAVLGVSDRVFGEVPVAFVVLRAGKTATADELAEHAGRSLAAFKVPAAILLEASFPLGKTGKVDKSALRRRWHELNTGDGRA